MPRDPRGPRPPTYPWDDLRTAYVEGWLLADGSYHWPSYAEVTERVHPEGRADHVRRRGGDEGWNEARRIHQAELERQRRQERASELAEVTVRLDNRALRAAETGLAVVQMRLAAMAQRMQEAANAGARGPDESAEANRLALAGVRFHVLGMRALGLEGKRAGALAQPEGDEDYGGVGGEVERRLAGQVRAYIEGLEDGAGAVLPPSGDQPQRAIDAYTGGGTPREDGTADAP